MPEPPATQAVCLGEALVVLQSHDTGPLRDAPLLARTVGGAEANVAGALAQLGIATSWVSRLGTDPFGEYIAQDLGHRDVDVIAEYDADRPTGLYFKDTDGAHSRMYYYRSGSAAAAMTAASLETSAVASALAQCRLVHTSGITAGVVAEDHSLLHALIELRDRHRFTLSVDLNWRPTLWANRDKGPLIELLRASDVMLAGTDEAAAALGSGDPSDVRRIVGPRPTIVLKSAAHYATECQAYGGTVTEVPALHVDIVESIGAGDGFAAGYLAGLLDGESPTARLRLGHLVAASTLATAGDYAPTLPEPRVRRALLRADADQWRATRVTPHGVELPDFQRDMS